MNSILEYTDKRFITFLSSREQMEAINELSLVFDESVCSDKGEILAALLEREYMLSTGIGFGIAIPHIRNNAVKKLSFAVGISKDGILYDSMDKKPVHIVIAVVAKERQHHQYLSLLAKIVGPLKNRELKQEIIDSESVDEIWEILRNNFS